MNKENAHEYLPLVQALADGKTLQHQNGAQVWTDYHEDTDFSFSEQSRLYRIKPEPRTFDVLISKKTKKVVVVENGDSDKDEIFFEWERITVMEVIK